MTVSCQALEQHESRVAAQLFIHELNNCNCCRVKYYFLLRISLCFVLVTLRYQMSDLVRCRLR